METIEKSDMLKYPSIENTYQQKHITNWLKYNPGLVYESFIVTEKYTVLTFKCCFLPTLSPVISLGIKRFYRGISSTGIRWRLKRIF